MKPDIAIKISSYNFSGILDFTFWKYPAGEIGVRLAQGVSGSTVSIRARIRSTDDIMTLLLLVDAIRRSDPEAHFKLLEIPYFPYARQDRVATEGDPHSLKVMVGLIDSLGFDRIEVTDPHSAAIENCFNKTHFSIAKHSTSRLKKVLDSIDRNVNATLIIPDEGAAKRVRMWAGLLYCQTASFVKERDPKTGALSGFKMVDGNVKGRKCLIVDDICDGGGTFLGIAAQLKAAGAGPLYLYVTHGIFSAGVDTLCKSFAQIYTTDSYQEKSLYDPRITVLECKS